MKKKSIECELFLNKSVVLHFMCKTKKKKMCSFREQKKSSNVDELNFSLRAGLHCSYTALL